MKRQLLFVFITLLFISCGSVKKTQEAINYGNYDEAISKALEQLRANKTRKGNQPYIYMLEDAYAKVTQRDLDKIDHLKKDQNPSNLESIFNLYLGLQNRQNQIKPLLPLRKLDNREDAKFSFNDYSNSIVKTKNELSSYLYEKALKMLNTSIHKLDFRVVYEDLKYLDRLNPDFKNTKSLLDEAHLKGTDFIYVSMRNNSDKILPQNLAAELLNFNTYNLNDFWVVYHNNKVSQVKYDFQLEINLVEINISPEQIKEREIKREREIVDGWEYQKDENGEVIKDSLGVKQKVDVYKLVKCRLNKVTQTKATQVIGTVKTFDLNTSQLIDSYPLASEFIFKHRFATFRGNKKALKKEDIKLVNEEFIPFPTNEQMVYDSGEDLKQKIKRILTRNKFRN